MTQFWPMIAPRLVNELMLVSVLVAGEGAPSLAAALELEGTAAEALIEGQTAPQGFDLAVLLAAPDSVGQDSVRKLVETLSSASERLLFAPLPLGAEPGGPGPLLPELTQWFEIFAEHGYQPVVEFDASFVSPGAFLVDRAATAAESELTAFADRLQVGQDSGSVRPGPPVEDTSSRGVARAELEGLRAELATVQQELAGARQELAAEKAALVAQHSQSAAREAAAQEAMQAAETRNIGWDGLRNWVRALVSDPSRDTEAALAASLPRLNAMRAPSSPIVLRHLTRLHRLRRFLRPPPSPAILADAALVRASRLFDAAWYVASMPELAEGAPLDPVFHYVLVGGPRGADPGPWFDTATYLAAHPELAGAASCPLVHAIRTGADRDMPSG